MKILVTGHAGFIGSNLVKRLFKEMQTGRIVGIDPSTPLRVNMVPFDWAHGKRAHHKRAA